MKYYLPSALLIASASAAVEIGLKKTSPAANPLAKRGDTYLQSMINNITGGGYYASIAVGTPPQPQLLLVDTGSSDTWVVAAEAGLCESEVLQKAFKDGCGETYNKSASSTYELVGRNNFSITYIDGSASSGDYFTDTVSIGNATIKNLQMGYATDIGRGTGILGVSYAASEATADTYPNVVDQFVQQGLIATKAYSLYLNDYYANTGSILFGGIDTNKFVGNLSVLPVLRTGADDDNDDASSSSSSSSNDTAYTVLAVGLQSMSAQTTTSSSTSTSTKKHMVSLSADDDDTQLLPAILDSGTTLSYLPSRVAASLFAAVGAYTDTRATGFTFVDCSMADADLMISLTFAGGGGGGGGGAVVRVPADMVVLDIFDAANQAEVATYVPFERTCLFGFQDMDGVVDSSQKKVAWANKKNSQKTSEYALLGDTFLRAAYVVYDLTNHEIALAQANLNSTTSNIVELAGAIPTTLTGVGVAAAHTASATTATSTATATTNTAKSTSSASKSAAPARSHGSSYGVLVAASIACLISIGIFAMI